MEATASLMTVTAFITTGKPSAVDGETCSPDLVLETPARERNSINAHTAGFRGFTLKRPHSYTSDSRSQ